MRQYYIFILLSLILLSACKGKKENSDIIVEIERNILTRDELESSIPKGLSKEDSVIFSENYIRSWMRDILFYDIASKNVSGKEEIDRLVENYRKSLIIYQYKDQLVNEKLSKDINPEEVRKYYEENQGKFHLDKILIKGIFLKIPAEAPQIDAVRSWYKSSSPEAIDNIEKYSVQNAVIYDYFYDNWVDLYEVIDNIPADFSNPVSTIQNKKQFELKDSSYYYFLNIKEYLLPGNDAPFEYAEQTIKEILINQKKMEFLKDLEDNLYNAAQKKGLIKYYNEE